MACHVSIVVPTYNTDPRRLKKLIRSVDAQSMPADDYELVFVDDGSTTDIFSTLKNLEAERSNVRAKRIPNSGWPCRPRNVGLDLAVGEYVLFMDHDDVLFPEGLERTYEFAQSTGADIVNPKEVRTKGWAWGWGQFTKNQRAAHHNGVSSLLPMTPHKFYRRQFLLDNDIKYIEESRVLWEDVYFNVLAYSKGARVAIYADYPLYHWVRTGSNTSTSFERDQTDRWKQLQRLIRFIDDTLPAQSDRDVLLTHWYKSRVLGSLTSSLFAKEEGRIDLTFGFAHETAETLIPRHLDDTLTPTQHAKAVALRRNDRETVSKIAAADHDMSAQTHADAVRWNGSKIEFVGSTTLCDGDGSPVKLRWDSRALHRDSDADIRSILGTEELDFAQAIEKGTYELSVKGRKSREAWKIKPKGRIGLKPCDDGAFNAVGGVSATIDIARAAAGKALDSQPWDVAARFKPLDLVLHRGVEVTSPEGLNSGALVNGRSVVAFKNKSGLLTIDAGGSVRHALDAAGLADVAATFSRRGKAVTVTVPLTRLHVHGQTAIRGRLTFNEVGARDTAAGSASPVVVSADARLIGDSRGARIETEAFALKPALYRVTAEFDGRTFDNAFIVDTYRGTRAAPTGRTKGFKKQARRVARKAASVAKSKLPRR